MTIYTTDGSALVDEKKELPHSDVEVEIVVEQKKFLNDDEEYLVYKDPVVPIARVPARRQPKRRIALLVCLVLGMVVGMAICIFSAIYLYSIYSPDSDYYGYCQVAYPPDFDAEYLNGSDPNNAALVSQQVNITHNIETFKVPSINEDQMTVIRHNFTKNFTAIYDDSKQACYVFPLRREYYLTPAELIATLLSMRARGILTPSAKMIKQHYKLVEPKLTAKQREEYGETNYDLCGGSEMYRLIEIHGDNEPSTTSTTGAPVIGFEQFTFNEFTGLDWMQHIIDEHLSDMHGDGEPFEAQDGAHGLMREMDREMAVVPNYLY